MSSNDIQSSNCLGGERPKDKYNTVDIFVDTFSLNKSSYFSIFLLNYHFQLLTFLCQMSSHILFDCLIGLTYSIAPNRHDITEILLKSGVKHHNPNPELHLMYISVFIRV